MKVKLGELSDIFIGITYKPENVTNTEGTIVLRSGNIQEGQLAFDDIVRVNCSIKDKFYVKENDILMCSRNGSAKLVGKSAIIKNLSEPMTFGAFMTIVRSPYNNYLQYFFKSRFFRQQLNSSATTTINQITRSMLSNIDVPVFDEDKSVMIANTLGLCENLIQMRKRELQRLDELIKARFVEMFGEPMDSTKANAYFTSCVEFNPKKSEVKDKLDMLVSFVPMECVGVDGSFSIKAEGVIGEFYKGYTYFRDGDVLLAKITPCFENGKVAIASGCKNGIGFGTTEFHVSRPIDGVSNSYWIKYLLKNRSVHEYATINMTGSAGQKRIQTPFFDRLKIYLPPIELQNQFADFVQQVNESKVAVQEALNKAQLLFDSLMQEYFG